MYGIEDGQIYAAADGNGTKVKVLDSTTYADDGRVVIGYLNGVLEGETARMDAFKLAMVRYYLLEE